MAIIATNKSLTMHVVLNNGTTETGRVKQLSINAAGGQEMKVKATNAGSYAVMSAVKSLYSQEELMRTRTEKADLINQ